MRAFVAVELPEPVRAGIREFVDGRKATLPGWRFSPPSSYHVTLRFLGEVEPRFVERAGPEWLRALAEIPPVPFELRGLGVFPSRRAPRVLWLGVEEAPPGGRLDAVFRSIESVCAALGLPAEGRPFHPHVTLARASRDARPRAPAETVDVRFGPLLATETVLFRSDLLPQGARHTALARFSLLGSP